MGPLKEQPVLLIAEPLICFTFNCVHVCSWGGNTVHVVQVFLETREATELLGTGVTVVTVL